jgi:non-ribosomal peptide synthetase-like protein
MANDSHRTGAPHTPEDATTWAPPGEEPRLLHELFEAQVRLRPDHPALECDDDVLTYGELDRLANGFAIALQSQGVGSGDLVALYADKSSRLFAAMLGILKAGAGYVPLDPKFPLGRVQGILEDADIAVAICDGKRGDGLNGQTAATLMSLEAVPAAPAAPPLQPAVVAPNDICYVIYTSGSTGRPKGVLIEHRNAVNFVHSLRTVYKLTADERIYQGFSLAFDASVEEIWAAFSLGGTLVVPSTDIARSAFDAAAFINNNNITYFSTVPPFLAMIAEDLPTVKLLVLGADVCPPELVQRWASPNRRLLNTYGPTEATVVATATECTRGEPVTIGKALPGYSAYVLDDKMKQVATGECGELYIGGASIARGYLNRPNLTAERFIANPFDGDGSAPRLYRTRDLVRPTDNGDLEFVGRADAQIKIRGFRIELSEIEAVLLENPAIRAAAVSAVEFGSLKELAAYVVLAPGVTTLDRERVSTLLRKRLPEYMIPRYLDVIDELPQMTSGKIDRKLLPPPQEVLGRAGHVMVPPATATERIVAGAWEHVFKLSSISVEDDFFLDLRGHSLFAAQAVTELRKAFPGTSISVPDFYEYRTVRRLAEFLDQAGATAKAVAPAGVKQTPEKQAAAVDAARPPLPAFRFLCVPLQALALVFYYAVVTAPVFGAIVLVMRWLAGQTTGDDAALIATVAGFAVWPAWLVISIAVKWLAIGRYKAGHYPVWGAYYFRWWLVTRFQELSLWGIFVGTPLMSLYFRAMGAKVGRGCSIDTPHCYAFDLISIGNDTSIGPETQLLGYRIENGWLILGRCDIGNECFVGIHACLSLNTRLENRARVGDMTHLADDAVVAADTSVRGSPAELGEIDVSALQDSAPPARSGRTRAFIYGFSHLLLIYAMGYFLILSAAPGLGLVAYALYTGGKLWGIGAAFAAVPISVVWYLFLVVAVKWIFIGRIRPGIYRQHSGAYLRYWFLAYLLNNTRYIILPIYATLFLPPFLRLLGAKIGRGTEISTVMQVMPDLLEIGDGSFLADACIIGGHRSYLGRIELRCNRIGSRTFIGNSALVPVGADVGDNVLIGVMSTPPQGAQRTADDTRWLGSPSFELPHTEEVSGFSDAATYHPRGGTVACRIAVETVRMLLPGIVATADLVVLVSAMVAIYGLVPLWAYALIGPVIAFLASFVAIAMVAFLKFMLMHAFRPIVRALWSPYVWVNDIVNAIYEAVAAPAMAPLMGTPLGCMVMRWMGCKVGRWVFLETTLFSEFDLVEIGDEAALNLGATVQTHLFEDRVMKSDFLKIGERASVGNMAVVLYSTEMQRGSSLDALSVLMKGEVLPAASCWTGIPTKRATTSIAWMKPAPVTLPAPVNAAKPAPPSKPPSREELIQARVDRVIAMARTRETASSDVATPAQLDK